VLGNPRVDLRVFLDLVAVPLEEAKVRADRIGRRGDRFRGGVSLHDATEKIQDVNERLLMLRTRLQVERVGRHRSEDYSPSSVFPTVSSRIHSSRSAPMRSSGAGALFETRR
jgi:uncharacterized protein involved in exopolysaccharide biosynthesis